MDLARRRRNKMLERKRKMVEAAKAAKKMKQERIEQQIDGVVLV